MCGSLRRESMDKRVGQDPQPEGLVAGWGGRGTAFPIVTEDGKSMPAEFNGHARSENLSGWLKNGWKRGDLHVSMYTEGHGNGEQKYEVPKGHTLRCIVRGVGTRGKVVFNIVTRDAEGKEKAVHPRFPQVGPRRY